jgi:sporulation-control protein spo0M
MDDLNNEPKTVAEAVEISKSIGLEIHKIVDKMLSDRLGTSEHPLSDQEYKALQKQAEALHKQQLDAFAAINRLSNGKVYINKKGTRFTISQKKEGE